LEGILQGRISPGYTEWSPVEDKFVNAKPTINHKMHAIGFIVDITAIKEDAQLEAVRLFLDKIVTQLKYKPLIIFTKSDKLVGREEGVKFKLRDIWDEHVLRQAIKRFREHVPFVEESDILLFSNYTSNYTTEERDYERELLLLYIINELKQRAESFVQSYFSQFLEVYDRDGDFLGSFPFRLSTDKVVDYERDIGRVFRDEEIPINTEFNLLTKDDRGRTKEIKRDRFEDKQLHEVWIEEDGAYKLKLSISKRSLLGFPEPVESPEPVERSPSTKAIPETLKRKRTDEVTHSKLKSSKPSSFHLFD